jgi:hypothetical protein
MVKRILTLAMSLALILVVALPLGLNAANTGTQQASTSGTSSSLNIVSKSADTAISTIVFPRGTPGATISNPYNNIDNTGDAQYLAESNSEPVVRIKNTSESVLKVYIEVSAWSNSIVSSENYALINDGSKNVNSLTQSLSDDGGHHIVNTETTLQSGVYGDLYLAVVLSNSQAISGSSTITILGELP